MAYDSALGWLGDPDDALLEVQLRLQKSTPDREMNRAGPPSQGPPPPGMERVTTTRSVVSSRKISNSFDGP